MIGAAGGRDDHDLLLTIRAAAVRLLGIDPETVYSIPNGVDIARFTPHRSSAQRPPVTLATLARQRPARLE